MSSAKEEYKRIRHEERLYFFLEEQRKIESGVDLCLRCDGLGCDGYEMIIVNGVSEPDIRRPLACKVCGGSGYVEYHGANR
jgi:hypothetical protein